MAKQIRIDGSVDMPTSAEGLERNKDGTLPAAHIKAIKWYMLQHGYLPTATNAWPFYHFKQSDGTYVKVHLQDILAEYAEFKQANYGSKRKVAA